MRLIASVRNTGITKRVTATAAFLSGSFVPEARVQSSPMFETRDVVGTISSVPVSRFKAENSTGDVLTIKLKDALAEPLTPTDVKKFRSLAVRRALQKATPQENDEFEQLQQRRRTEESSSTEEILAECSRRRFYSEMMEVLTRNVRILHPEDQKKLATIPKT